MSSLLIRMEWRSSGKSACCNRWCARVGGWTSTTSSELALLATHTPDGSLRKLPGCSGQKPASGYNRTSPWPWATEVKKDHRFDLGSDDPPILVECKSYTWTSGGNSPSAKIRSLNEAMLHFLVAPEHYRKVLFVLKHMKGELSLATHYVRTQGHLIGPGVEVWEFDLDTKQGVWVL